MRIPIQATLAALLFLTMACRPLEEAGTPPEVSPLPPTVTAAPTATAPYVYLTPTPGYPEAGFGPHNFPVDINPLTGQSANPILLERRPILVKVSNLPREVRPQYGLSRADIVYEYYTEEGTTRFAALYYSQEAGQVGPIRSARFFDEHLVRMYAAWFVFGSGDERVRQRLWDSGFANRFILEWQAKCPALCRSDPLTNALMGNTIAIREYNRQRGLLDARQNLEGMRFQQQAPPGGQPASQVYVWYSAAIYNRWDYDLASGRFFRFSDAENALEGQPEIYAPLSDALTGQPIGAENVVILLMKHEFFSTSPEIVEMDFSSSGPAYTFRDGQVYELEWQRPTEETIVSLVSADGSPFPLKPGITWFEVMGISTKIIQEEDTWRFEMRFP
ncbi:MAG: DUF3048 domain-containing protein [Anaerolineales bacterium]